MPQFDFFSFFVQIFWFSIARCVFYLIYLKMPINNSSQVIKMRNKLKVFTSNSSAGLKKGFIYNSATSFF
jgi:hypothetical protein